MKRLFLLAVSFFCLLSFTVADGRTFSWDFSGGEIKDIVFAVSLDTGISIVCDDTVAGNADFKFNGEDFGVAFEAFLGRNRLFVEKRDDVWIVSKIRISCESDLFTLDACDLTPGEILEKFSCSVEDVITFDVLPVSKMSVHFKNLSEFELLDSLCKRLGNYVVQKTENGFHVGKTLESKKLDLSDGYLNVSVENDVFKIDAKNCKFCDVVEKLFSLKFDAVRSFCFVSKGDSRITRTFFEENNFDDTLRKLCNQNGFGFTVQENVYYFFEDALAKENLISGERNWICYNLKYSSAQELFPLLLKKIEKLECFTGTENSFFYAKVNDTENKIITSFIEEIDIKKSVFVVNLKYIKPEELLRHLPPCVDKGNLFLADDNSCLYFKGTEEAYKNFCEQIEICDRPEIRVTYDLLIVQYDETFQNSWNMNFGLGNSKIGDRNIISGQLGSILGLNINVVSSFGLNFAANLQGAIEENKSSVYADTTLHGISGKTISFKNSSTYRYRDNNLDPDTGKPIYSGVTKEIVSGINIQVTPWVSGDGMITSSVTASISRQGIDTSASTGNPPPTTEKVITTEVCSKNGEPVVLSGLIQNALSEDSKGMPLIGQIPGLKKLLNSSGKNKEKSQMVIFLVPRIEEISLYENREKRTCEKIQKLLEMLEV